MKVPLSAASLPVQMLKWYFIALPKSYLVENVFRSVTYLLSNVCNCGVVVNK